MSTIVSDPVDLSVCQFVEAWRLMCNGAHGYRDVAEDGIHYIFSGIPIPFFNVAVLTGRHISSETLRGHGEAACRWASTCAAPWLFVLTQEALAAGVDAASVLDACGLAPLMPLTGMIAHDITPGASTPEGLQLTRPQSDDECATLLDVNGLAYSMDLGAGKEVIGKQDFWADHFPALGLTGGKPASCAGVMMVDGYRYVALVATDPAQQRRGYGDAAMRYALDMSARVHGHAPTTLHATEAGRPIYERMGYSTIAKHTVFMEKSFLNGH